MKPSTCSINCGNRFTKSIARPTVAARAPARSAVSTRTRTSTGFSTCLPTWIGTATASSNRATSPASRPRSRWTPMARVNSTSPIPKTAPIGCKSCSAPPSRWAEIKARPRRSSSCQACPRTSIINKWHRPARSALMARRLGRESACHELAERDDHQRQPCSEVPLHAAAVGADGLLDLRALLLAQLVEAIHRQRVSIAAAGEVESEVELGGGLQVLLAVVGQGAPLQTGIAAQTEPGRGEQEGEAITKIHGGSLDSRP